MIRAIKYRRVSTDEQKEKGFSLRVQDEALTNYCEHHKINAVADYVEDYSAKTFDRPEFNKLLAYLKQHKGLVNMLLITKWDRFSRDVREAYRMLDILERLGVRVNAIEQPIDFSIPESSIMLAFYLATPEAENRRRAKNVIEGMRRAKKEGRSPFTAPKGYKNIRVNKRATLEFSPEAEIIRDAFEMMAKGVYSIYEVYTAAKSKGLKVQKTQFYDLLKNPFYCGKIYLAAYGDEPESWIEGAHEPLISESTFQKVQSIIKSRRRVPIKNQMVRPAVILRGFLKCERCGGNLTGSISTSSGGLFPNPYYHCRNGCPTRYNANKVNADFMQLLSRLKPSKGALKLFETIVMREIKDGTESIKKEKAKVQQQLEQIAEKITDALESKLERKISDEDYQLIKARYEKRRTELLQNSASLQLPDEIPGEHLTAAVKMLENLQGYYEIAPPETQRKLITSIFYGKIHLENGKCRESELNPAIALICSTDAGNALLPDCSNTQNTEISGQAILSEVEGGGLFSYKIE